MPSELSRQQRHQAFSRLREGDAYRLGRGGLSLVSQRFRAYCSGSLAVDHLTWQRLILRVSLHVHFRCVYVHSCTMSTRHKTADQA